MGIRTRFAFIAILAMTITLLGPATAIAADKLTTADVAAARVAAENELAARGINPWTAVFQIGARNYAGADCPGSGWNCTSAATVVQIATGAGPTSANKFDGCTAASCTIIQDSTATGGNNEARCVQRPSNNTDISDDSQTSTNPASQWCTITQTTTTGRNRAFVLQLIVQGQAEGSQDATQSATVHQTNTTGANDSLVAQTIRQNESKHISDAIGATQKQEAHQTAFVCQGASNPCFSKSQGNNTSSLAQTNIQRASVQFGAGANGAITQNQNTDPSGGPKSQAVVRQNSTDETNDATLRQFNRQVGTVHTADTGDDEDGPDATAGFGGSVTQTQGNGPLCTGGGLCGFEFQTLNPTTGTQKAVEGQDEVMRLVAPPGASQTQSGPEFCCATQTGGTGNVNNISQSKVLHHTSSSTQGHIQGHCFSPNGDCSVNETLTDNGTTKTNSCTGTSCNITVHCSTTPGEGGPITTCFSTSGEGSPTPPCPPDTGCPDLLSAAEGPAAVRADALLWRADGSATG